MELDATNFDRLEKLGNRFIVGLRDASRTSRGVLLGSEIWYVGCGCVVEGVFRQRHG